MKALHHPLFLFSLLTLLVNDWYAKAAYGNLLTGKLSDVAGLFAFTYFLLVCYPKWKRYIPAGVALFFVWWKSPSSQWLINWFQANGYPAQRTVDFTDLAALPVIILAAYVFSGASSAGWKGPRWSGLTISTLSLLAFVATSLPPQTIRTYPGPAQAYTFECSRKALLGHLNFWQLRQLRTYPPEQINYLPDADIFMQSGYGLVGQADTLAVIFSPQLHTVEDTLRLPRLGATIIVKGNDSTATLRLLSISRSLDAYRRKDYRERTIREFERQLVRKIQRKAKAYSQYRSY